MSSVLKEKIAGMTDQQAEKLSRELQEVWKRGTAWENATWLVDFPVLLWLVNCLRIEGSIAEQVHICTACNRGLHLGDSHTYTDHDQKLWQCKCTTCKGDDPWPTRRDRS